MTNLKQIKSILKSRTNKNFNMSKRQYKNSPFNKLAEAIIAERSKAIGISKQDFIKNEFDVGIYEILADSIIGIEN